MYSCPVQFCSGVYQHTVDQIDIRERQTEHEDPRPVPRHGVLSHVLEPGRGKPRLRSRRKDACGCPHCLHVLVSPVLALRSRKPWPAGRNRRCFRSAVGVGSQRLRVSVVGLAFCGDDDEDAGGATSR